MTTPSPRLRYDNKAAAEQLAISLRQFNRIAAAGLLGQPHRDPICKGKNAKVYWLHSQLQSYLSRCQREQSIHEQMAARDAERNAGRKQSPSRRCNAAASPSPGSGTSPPS